MRRVTIILLAALLSFTVKAQVIFKTIVSRNVVTAGESFPIQYVLEDAGKDDGFVPPDFTGFRVVSGPYTYGGKTLNGNNETIPLKNISFTLVALKPGRYIIAGATAKINGRFIKSDNAVIDVISKAEAFRKSAKENSSEYFLQPGEDPYEKMRKNLFMKVMVDRKSCYVGQPVVATFKLYSRLESKSDIVKNPGFYGFTVQDIISLGDKIVATEIVNGKPFDVHTVRTVQLYPLQAGEFIIDPMEVTNSVEFSKSAVNKKTEQEIAEGVFERPDTRIADNTVIYENSINTEKITINVKPYPVVKKPATFNGATGNFSIRILLQKNELAKNEEGAFIITIGGKGNFTQLSAPVVQWPSGIEGFDPVIKDSLDKTQSPLKGSRIFRFPFIAGKAGGYSIPAISFTFFDPDSNKYKTVSAELQEVKISNEEIKTVPEKIQVATTRKKDYTLIVLSAGITLLLLLFILFWARRTRKLRVIRETVAAKTAIPVSIEQLLQPAQFSLIADDGRFYTLLQKIIWNYLSGRLGLTGSRINKDELQKAMKEKKPDDDQYRDILGILQQCEAAVFTKAEFLAGKQELLNRTKVILEQINGS